MAKRRSIYRKQQPQPTSRKGLLFCVLLAAGVVLVPAGSDFVRDWKGKARDWAIKTGVIDLNGCVVTPEHALACTSNATGIPLSAALRQMAEQEAQSTEDKRQRAKAESALRQMALEVERLNAQVAQSQMAPQGDRAFPPFVTEVTPTARTGTSEPDAESIGSPDSDALENTVSEPEIKPETTTSAFPTAPVEAPAFAGPARNGQSVKK